MFPQSVFFHHKKRKLLLAITAKPEALYRCKPILGPYSLRFYSPLPESAAVYKAKWQLRLWYAHAKFVILAYVGEADPCKTEHQAVQQAVGDSEAAGCRQGQEKHEDWDKYHPKGTSYPPTPPTPAPRLSQYSQLCGAWQMQRLFLHSLQRPSINPLHYVSSNTYYWLT